MEIQTPIALVGAACRFPGADSCQRFWSNIREKKGFLTPPPEGRWKEHPPYTGGFIKDLYGFDAERFSIAPPESEAMDPQQRLMLTLIDELRTQLPDLETNSIGVFIGAGHPAYIETVLHSLGPDAPKELLAGNLLSLISARISYTFDLRGPAMTLDCACASSLVALQQAA